MCRASDDYIAVMDVLEASVTDMTPADVVAALAAAGHPMQETATVMRLDKLRTWTAVSARTDHGRILRYSDIATFCSDIPVARSRTGSRRVLPAAGRPSSSGYLRCPVELVRCRDPALWSGPGLEDHVERGLRGPAELGVAGLFEHLAQPRFAGLRAERRSWFLGQRVWCADRG